MILLVVALFIPTGANALALGAGPLSKLLVPVSEQIGKAVDEAGEAFWRVIGKDRNKKTMSPDDVAMKNMLPRRLSRAASRCRHGGQEEERKDAT